MLNESNLEKLSKEWSSEPSLNLRGEFPKLYAGVLGIESANENGLFPVL